MLARRRLGLVVAVGWAVAAPGAQVWGQPADTPWSWQAELGSSVIRRSGSSHTRLGLGSAQALGGGVDRRLGPVHAFLRGEGNLFSSERDDGSRDFAMTFNLGLGLRLDQGGGRVRSSVAAGGSWLVVPTDVDNAPSVGLFVDVRPVGFVWPLGRGARIGVFPLSLTLVMPVVTGIPLISIQYRATVFAERGF
jgi:hypothetical protein